MPSSRHNQQQQPPHQQLRTSFAGDLASCGPAKSSCGGPGGRAGCGGGDGSGSDTDSDSSDEEELSEADLRLQSALRRYDHVDLDQRMLQVCW
jgi:hypothetical protein